MPRNYATKELLDRIRDQIARQSNQIQDIRAISNKDKAGIDLFIIRLKNLVESSKSKKDLAIDGLLEDGSPRYDQSGRLVPALLIESRMQERMSLIFRGEQKAFEAVLEMLESPDLAVAELVKERDALQGKLKELESIERTEPVADNG